MQSRQHDQLDETIAQLDILITHFAGQQQPLMLSDDAAFAEICEQVTVTKEHHLIFRIEGNLELTEKTSAL